MGVASLGLVACFVLVDCRILQLIVGIPLVPLLRYHSSIGLNLEHIDSIQTWLVSKFLVDCLYRHLIVRRYLWLACRCELNNLNRVGNWDALTNGWLEELLLVFGASFLSS